MKVFRRQFVQLAAAALMLSVGLGPARAETYPARPVRIIVPVAAGGTLDIAARLIAQWLTDHLGQSFFVDNKPGAHTSIGIDAVVHAPADGYTLLIIPPSSTVNGSLYNNLRYNFIRDIVPIATLTAVPLVMEVSLSVPAKTVGQFISYAKANPGKINMASGGVGSPEHMVGELFKMETGIDMLHLPYNGGAPALIDLIGGRVQVMFSALPESISNIRAGKVRALAVTTAQRSKALPRVPTVAETVPGFEAISWQGIGAPRGTPANVVALLNKSVNEALADPKIRAKLEALGGEPMPMSPSAFGKFIAGETAKWRKVIEKGNIKP